MATTSVNWPADLAQRAAQSSCQSPVGSSVRSPGWSAIDVAAEAELEAQVNKKPTFRRALFGWLIEFNRY